MTKQHTPKYDYELPRNKSLQKLCIIFLNLGVRIDCGNHTKKERQIARKKILKNIQRDICCNKRTAYDYIQAVQCIMESLPLVNKEAVIGGKIEQINVIDRRL